MVKTNHKPNPASKLIRNIETYPANIVNQRLSRPTSLLIIDQTIVTLKYDTILGLMVGHCPKAPRLMTPY